MVTAQRTHPGPLATGRGRYLLVQEVWALPDEYSDLVSHLTMWYH